MSSWDEPAGYETDATEVADAEAEPTPARYVPAPPETGDDEVDAALAELAVASAGSLADRITAGAQTLEVLQGRLRGLGGE